MIDVALSMCGSNKIYSEDPTTDTANSGVAGWKEIRGSRKEQTGVGDRIVYSKYLRRQLLEQDEVMNLVQDSLEEEGM